MKLFITGFFQVFFVAVNTVFLARRFTIGVLIAAFFISYLWSINVKKIAFGSHLERVIYACGAAIGSVAGMYFAGLWL
jgi:hypothetical protein